MREQANDRPEWCICLPDFYKRRRLDPMCRHDEMEELYELIDDLKMALAAADPHETRFGLG